MLGALLGGVAAGVIGGVLGGNAQKSAAKTAANQADRAAQMNNALARDMYSQNTRNMTPFMQSGTRANAMLDAWLYGPQAAAQPAQGNQQFGSPQPVNAMAMPYGGGGIEDLQYRPGMIRERMVNEGGIGAMQYGAPAPVGGQFQTTAQPAQQPQQQALDPQGAFRNYISMSDYGFQLGEGQNALNHGLASRGMIQSGAAMKDMERFRQNLQAGYRNEYLDRITGQQNTGMAGASALAGVGQNMVSNISQNNNSAASAAANAALTRGAATSNLYGSIAGGIGNMIGLASSYGGINSLGGSYRF